MQVTIQHVRPQGIHFLFSASAASKALTNFLVEIFWKSVQQISSTTRNMASVQIRTSLSRPRQILSPPCRASNKVPEAAGPLQQTMIFQANPPRGANYTLLDVR